MNKIYIFIFLIFLPALTYAQIDNKDMKMLMLQNSAKIDKIKADIKAKGITEAELTAKLKDRGIDLQNLKPDQINTLELSVDDAIREIETEKMKVKSDIETKPTNEEKKAKEVDLDNFDFQNNFTKSIEESFNLNENKQKTARFLTDSIKSSDTIPFAIFGQQIFKYGNPKLFTSSENINPANDYLLGPGDVVRIVIFGRSLYDGNLEVDDQGYIDPKTLPQIYVKGTEWGKVKKLIEARYKQRYSFNTGEIAITLKKTRNITVSVFGEVVSPGSYTYSAANTAFNLIALAKGLTDLGSVRNIQIVTPGGGVRIYDVYKSMMDPGKATNIYLQNNDFIQVPVAQKVVSINGSVNRPYRYELLTNEGLADLIKYAGGFKADAYQDNIQIIRFENGARKIYSVKFSDAKKFILHNGDDITVIPSSGEVKNMLTIAGDIERPGEFEWKEGMRASDVSALAGIKRTTRQDLAYIKRLNSDNSYNLLSFSPDTVSRNQQNFRNFILRPNDKIIFLSQADFTQYYKVDVSGAVRMPGEFEYDPARNINVYDAVNLAGGLRPDALPKAYVVRTDTATGARSYALFNLEKAMSDPSSSDNFTLEPLDRIVILSNSIINTESTVTIGGAVKNPGKFKYGISMNLLDAITLSGGLRAEAATNRVEIYRVILNNNEPTRVTASTFEIPRDLIMAQDIMSHVQLEPFDMIEVRSVPKYGLQKVVNVIGEVKYPGEYALIKDNENIYDLIKRAGGLTPEAFTGGATLERTMDKTGLVIIQLDEILRRPGASYNISMMHGDVLNIPKNNDLVSIQGAVNIRDIIDQGKLAEDNKINVAYIEGKSARYYIREFAGGFAENADHGKVYVKDANGKKSKVKSFLFFKKYPKVKKGASIVVDYKDPKKIRTEPKEKTDWVKVLGESVAQATAILTLVVLINTINKS